MNFNSPRVRSPMLHKEVLIAFAALSFATQALADGSAVDKVYHPYVDALESEITVSG